MKITYIKMRYSIEPKDKIYVKGYGFLSFGKKKWAKILAINIVKNFLRQLKNLQQMQ